MRRIILSFCCVVLLAAPAPASDREVGRVRAATEVLEETLNIPDAIPQDLLDKAECVIVVPSTMKFAIGFGGSYGRGVITCRSGPEFNGMWSPPAMMAVEGASFGLQLGGQATDYVFLVMNARGANAVLSSKTRLGVDASIAAGPKGRNATANTDASLRAEILGYSRNRGLFAGISLEGSTLRPDNSATEKLYGRKVTARGIVLENAVGATPEGLRLANLLQNASPKNLSS